MSEQSTPRSSREHEVDASRYAAQTSSSNARHHFLPMPPKPAWMWKPRSTLVNSEGSAKSATSLLQLRRIGAKRWNRRFVFLDHQIFCYGTDKGRRDKQIPFELLEQVRREPADKMSREHAPKEFASFGWYLAVKGRTLLFCAESEAVAQEWVAYLSALLRAMTGSLVSPLPDMLSPLSLSPVSRAATEAAAGDASRGRASRQNLDARDGNGEADNANLAEERQREENNQPLAQAAPEEPSHTARVPPSTTPSAASAGAVAAAETGPSKGIHRRSVSAGAIFDDALTQRTHTYTASASSTGRARTPGRRGDQPSDDEEADEEEQSAASLFDASSDDTEGGDSDTEDDRSATSRSATTAGSPGADEHRTDRLLSREMRYGRFLLSLAAGSHSHIGYRLPVLESHFKYGDDSGSVVFSRMMEKVGKHDNAQAREVVLTTRHLYLFSKARNTGSQKVRCIDTHDITGVIESTTDATLVAVLVPTFHDLLLRAVAQNSCVPGTLPEVKQQLVAHLYKAHSDAHTDHRFLFRQSSAVAKEVRRTTEAKYPVLAVRAGDQMRLGERLSLLQTFARNADVAVYWSSMVRQVRASGKPQLCALAITEGSIYCLSNSLQEVVRRTSMQDLLHVEYDRDAQTILLQCRGVDVLFNMQSSAEFDAFLQVLPVAMADGYGRTLRLVPSKQLYSHAKLFSVSTLGGVGGEGGAGAAAPASSSSAFGARRHFGFHWRRGKKGGTGTKLLSSFAATPAEDNSEGEADVATRHGLRDDHRNSQAIRRFCAQFRFVEEVLQDYGDAVALLQQHGRFAGTASWDTLGLRSAFSTQMLVGEICWSAPCRLLDAKECNTLAKTSSFEVELSSRALRALGTPRGVCVTSEGVLFLRSGAVASHGAASAGLSASGAGGTSASSSDSRAAGLTSAVRDKVKSRWSSAVSHVSHLASSGKGDDEAVLSLVGWSTIAAVVRCHTQEGSSVALLTNRAHPVDYLFYLDSDAQVLDLTAAAMGCYCQYRPGTADHTHLLPLYTAPRVQNLAVALKKTTFDPFPTVALRYTPRSFPSDRLRIAFIPDVADACRRFGDNTVYFSGVAWRVRSATLRRCNGHLEQDPGADMRRQNNHLYKSFILIVTNVAVYHCTKGGFEVVRRTLLTDLRGITVSARDADTVLLSVPSEYDMYFRVEGRGHEFVSRLQEAYVEWTNYGHYLPHEELGSHAVHDYGLPLRASGSCVAAQGTLTKPAYFNDLQSSRPAVECLHQTQQWHLRHLRRAMASFERVQAVARKERRPPAAPACSTWTRMQAALADRQSYLYFVHRRCFRFGVTSEDFTEMQRAQELLRTYREMATSAQALLQATLSGDPEVFQEALRRADAVPDLRVLVDEETAVYNRFCARRECLQSVFAVLHRYRYRPKGSVSLPALETALVELLGEAWRLELDASFMAYLVQGIRVVTQRTQLQRLVCDPTRRPRLSILYGDGAGEAGGWALVQQAASEVGMAWTPPRDITAAVGRSAGPSLPIPSTQLRLNLRVAALALRRCAIAGEPSLTRAAVALAVGVLRTWDATQDRLEKEDRGDHDGHLMSSEAAMHQELEASADAVRQAVREAMEQTQAQFTATEKKAGPTGIFRLAPPPPPEQQFARELETLIATRQIHQRQQTWTRGNAAALLSKCTELEAYVAAHPRPARQDAQAVLSMEHALLTEQEHRLRQLQRLRDAERRAQQQHERALQETAEAAQQDATRQQHRETTLLGKRQRKALRLWSRQVRQVTEKLVSLLESPEEEAHEDLRLEVKRCVHLRRWIVDAGARYGLSVVCASFSPTAPQAAPTPTPDGAPLQVTVSQSADSASATTATATATVNGSEVKLGGLLSQLQSAVGRAELMLEERKREEEGKILNAMARQGEGKRNHATAPIHTSDDAAANPLEKATLPVEVEALIATHDTEGLIAYIQEDEGGLQEPPTRAALLDQIRAAWQQARRQRQFVEALHRRLNAAAILRSGELLKQAVRQATEAQYTDAAVEKARQIVPLLLRRCEGEQREEAPCCFAEVQQGDVETISAPKKESTDIPEVLLSLPPPTLRATEATPSVAEDADVAAAEPSTPPPLAAAHPLLVEMTHAMVELTSAPAAAASPSLKAAASEGGVVYRLYAVAHALVSTALAATEKDVPPAAIPRELHITADNPYCAGFLQAWRAVLLHHVRPRGLFLKTPRIVWDVAQDVSEMITCDARVAAPPVVQLVRDFRRLYRSTDDSEAGRSRTDAVLLALAFFSHRLHCLLDGLAAIGEEGRQELLLPCSVLAQASVRTALAALSAATDRLQWDFDKVQSLAMECLFPREAAAEVPALPPILQARSSAKQEDSTERSGEPPQHCKRDLAEREQRLGSPAALPATAATSAAPRREEDKAGGTAPTLTPPPQLLSPHRTAETVITAATGASDEKTIEVVLTRAEGSARALANLRKAVHAVADYFTQQLRLQEKKKDPLPPRVDNYGSAAAVLFDEHYYAEVGTLVDASVLPALLQVLTGGLIRRYQLVRTRTFWDVLCALRVRLEQGSRTLAGAEVQPILELVEALTSRAKEHGQSAAKLRVLSDEQWTRLRERMFLRECINRRQLFPLVSTLFPSKDGNDDWTGHGENEGEGDGALWTLYDPQLCLLYPPDDPSVVPLRALLQRLSALPFILIVDRELR